VGEPSYPPGALAIFQISKYTPSVVSRDLAIRYIE
jgi:hypothetical protein